ncbi:MAG: hypothetical protein AMXMBFR13_49860 [Phycisphaerae bacterium]
MRAADQQLRELAVRYVHRGLQYPETPAVRVHAIEASADVLGAEGRVLLRKGLKDEHPAVRFAALIALGRVKDPDAREDIRALTLDRNPHVRIGAYFAMERLGDPSYRGLWADLLRRHEDPAVRRNAALALGQLEDERVMALLSAAASTDKDEGVRLQALEGMAMLGNPEAISRFLQDSFGGTGYHQPFALLTLGHVDDARIPPALRTRLEAAPYLEARLAAARSLGSLGYHDGYGLALRSLNWNSVRPDVPDDPPENQIMRVRTMAALALGEIGDRQALPVLKQRMETPDDPRVQLAAATAILMILDRA